MTRRGVPPCALPGLLLLLLRLRGVGGGAVAGLLLLLGRGSVGGAGRPELRSRADGGRAIRAEGGARRAVASGHTVRTEGRAVGPVLLLRLRRLPYQPYTRRPCLRQGRGPLNPTSLPSP